MSRVTMLAHTPEPEKLVAAAAKLCYSPARIDELLNGLTPEKTAAFLGTLMRLGHQSPLEHASFTFGIEGVSRTLLAQITRHRIASYSVQSQRYVAENDFEYVVPPAIEQDTQAFSEFEDAMRDAAGAYARIADILREKYISELPAELAKSSEARGAAQKRAIEDARFVLPGACDTKMILTMNTRSLRSFFAQRCCNRAQWEIRGVADEMLCLCRKTAPLLFIGAGPGCVGGACPEGGMSCGKAAEMRERYGND